MLYLPITVSESQCAEEKAERKNRMNQAETTHIKRYKELTELEYCYPLYNSFLREDLRMIITRWRLSCVPLEIEVGRYKGVVREERFCPFCDVVEDEEHAVMRCEAYNDLRRDNRELFQANTSIKEFLNPKDHDTAYKVGCLLKDIEERRKSLVERQS